MSNPTLGWTIGGAAVGLTYAPLPVAGTIDPVNDYIAIYTNSLTATQSINRNTLLGISSAPVGLSDSQTLTNKTLTSPTISGPSLSGTITGTYTIGGTPTFPTSVVTLTGSQTLTNKTLTSPTLNSPTLTNASITADAITGFTVSNSGTIYGVSVSTGSVAVSGNLSATGTFAVSGSTTLTGNLTSAGQPSFLTATAPPSAGLSSSGIKLSSTTNFGIFFGSGAPTFSAAQGSIYMRSDGSSTSTRLYVNTNGSTTWTTFTSAA